MIMLNPIKTKFGEVSVETLMHPREEEERIKIYDSDDNYLDYFSVEALADCAVDMETTIEEEYAVRLKAIREADSIEELVCILTADCVSITKSESRIAEHDYINRIGNYYLVMAE